jgi:hypothetical protein
VASDKTTVTTRRYINIQSPIRALLYGIAIWFTSALTTSAPSTVRRGLRGSPRGLPRPAELAAGHVLSQNPLLEEAGEG